jgi:hypothetical protein
MMAIIFGANSLRSEDQSFKYVRHSKGEYGFQAPEMLTAAFGMDRSSTLLFP